MAYVYKHIRKDTNEVFYIGIGKTKKRYYQTDKRSKHWKRIVNKVGFEYEIIEDGLTWEQANEREIYWIKFYGRLDLKEGLLINKTNGGGGVSGYILSYEHRKKISKANYGKPKSDIAKEKLRKSKIGTKASQETKDKMSKTRLSMDTTNPGKPIIADGIEYKNSVEASKLTGVSTQNIFYRLKNPKWNWHYKNLVL